MTCETKTDLRLRVFELRNELDAVIMAHNYQLPEVQEVADYTGDSLELAREATSVEARVLVMCGVRFMAETMAILNPERMVLLSEGTAGCPMADMIDAGTLREWKARYPGLAVVCYVNSPAEVKAESDYCCTSANAVEVVEAVPEEEVLFVPDQNLGHYVSTKTRKRVVLYPGYCNVHARITGRHIRKARREHPESLILAHPECRPEVVEAADAVLSTSQMVRFVEESSASSFVVGTEKGLICRLEKDNPGKEFHLLSPSLVCADMKKTTLEGLAETMEYRKNLTTVPEDVRVRAKRAIDRMLDL